MKRLCGFALFFFSLGVAFGYFIPNPIWHFICCALFLILSYCLFLH